MILTTPVYDINQKILTYKGYFQNFESDLYMKSVSMPLLCHIINLYGCLGKGMIASLGFIDLYFEQVPYSIL